MPNRDRPRIVVTRPSLPGDALEALAADFEVVRRQESGPATAAEVAELVRDADALVSVAQDELSAEVSKAGQYLRAVGSFGVGLDRCDLPAFTDAGIPVGNTPGAVTESTADMTWMLILGAARRLPEALAEFADGEWPGQDLHGLLGLELSRATIGIVGYGAIGQAVARRARGFGMTVHHYARTQASDEVSTWLPLEELLATSDVVSVHTPLTPETRSLIGADAFAAMKTSAILVNTSRGPVVDQDALVQALRAGEIAGAGLDVTDPEPIPLDHPLVSMPNCLITPHIGSATRWTRGEMTARCAANVRAGLAGEPMPWCANPEVYEGSGSR